MKASELNRILTATQAAPAPYPSLSLRASQISHRSPTKSKKGQATTYWSDPFSHSVADGVRLPLTMGSDPINRVRPHYRPFSRRSPKDQRQAGLSETFCHPGIPSVQ